MTDTSNPTDALFAALIKTDENERFAATMAAIEAGADCGAVQNGQNALSVLLGAHTHLGRQDPELVRVLVEHGADVNFRERRGSLILRLAITIRAGDDEERRGIYEALFGAEDLDLSLPSNVNNPVNTVGEWLRMNVDKRPGKLGVLDEFLQAAGQ